MSLCGGSRSGMSHGMSLHTIGIGHVCIAQSVSSDMLDSDIDLRQRCSLMMEMEVGDDGTAGALRLGYYKHQTASHSLRTSARQRCTCIFLVTTVKALDVYS